MSERPTVWEVENEPDGLLCPPPGVYADVPFETYCSWNAINHSRLKRIDKSPEHYITEEPDRDENKALRFGSLAHCGVLETATLGERYAVMPEYELDPQNVKADGTQTKSKATAWYKQQKAAFESDAAKNGWLVIPASEHALLYDMIERVERNKLASAFLNQAGQAEVSIVWHDRHKGLRCKARIDKVIDGVDYLSEFKTCQDPGERLEWDIYSYGYHTQAAWYLDGWNTLHPGKPRAGWHMVFVGKERPIQCVAAPLDPEAIEVGRATNAERLSLIAECQARGSWPGYDNPSVFSIPDRYIPERELNWGET